MNELTPSNVLPRCVQPTPGGVEFVLSTRRRLASRAFRCLLDQFVSLVRVYLKLPVGLPAPTTTSIPPPIHAPIVLHHSELPASPVTLKSVSDVLIVQDSSSV